MAGSYCIFHIWHPKHMFTTSPLTLWLECKLIKWPDSPTNLTSEVGKTDSQASFWWLFLVVFPSVVMKDKRAHLATQGQPYMLACKSRWPCLHNNRLHLSHPDSINRSDNLFPWVKLIFFHLETHLVVNCPDLWQETFRKPHIWQNYDDTPVLSLCFI